MKEFCPRRLHLSSPLLSFKLNKPVLATHFLSDMRQRLSVPAPTVTKPQGDFDSLGREQDYSSLTKKRSDNLEHSAYIEEGKDRAGRERERGRMNAMHVWEVVLAS